MTHRLALPVILVAFLSMFPACNEKSSALKPSPTVHPEREIKSNVKKSSVHRFGNYVFELPERFQSAEMTKIELPPGIQVASFIAPGVGGETEESFSLFRLAAPDALSEIKKNPRQQLVNFSAGFTDKQGWKISKRGDIRVQRLGEEALFLMPLMVEDGKGAQMVGFVSAIKAEDHVLNAIYLAFSGDLAEKANEAEAHMGTFELTRN